MPRKVSRIVDSKDEKNSKNCGYFWKILLFLILPLILGVLGVNFKSYTVKTICGSPKTVPQVQKSSVKVQPSSTKLNESKNPTYAVVDEAINNLKVIDDVLSRFYVDKIEIKGPIENLPMDWDLLWTYFHFEKYRLNWSSLKPHQKINHWPGNTGLAKKSLLVLKVKSNFIPKAFFTVNEVQRHSMQNPGMRFVTKHQGNRGVKLIKNPRMDFKIEDNHFVQEFVENPFLWNKHKFDFSIYVALTSVKPIRLYYYAKTVNLRFTPKPYSTDDPDDVTAYVIDNEHITGQHFEPVKKFIDKGFTNRDAFEDFAMSKGANLYDIWQKVEDLIRTTILATEKDILSALNRTKTVKYNHFELFRFDMMFNENFDVFLLEVNMSPNINADEDRTHNKLMFENLIFNLFNLVGVGTTYKKENFKFLNNETEMMVANPDGLSARPKICLSPACENSCNNVHCDICWHCMDNTRRYDLIQAYQEQMNAGEFKRIFPPDQRFLDKSGENFLKTLNQENRWTVERFSDLCQKNTKFC